MSESQYNPVIFMSQISNCAGLMGAFYPYVPKTPDGVGRQSENQLGRHGGALENMHFCAGPRFAPLACDDFCYSRFHRP